VKVIPKAFCVKIVFVLFLYVCLENFIPTKGEAQNLFNVHINDFVLPIFGTDGQKIWEVHGETTIMIEKDQLRVKKVNLYYFSNEKSKGLFSPPVKRHIYFLSYTKLLVIQRLIFSDKFFCLCQYSGAI
jgi:hypothetical protein